MKGVSNNDTPNKKSIKGKVFDGKKPLQVLQINKKESQSVAKEAKKDDEGNLFKLPDAKNEEEPIKNNQEKSIPAEETLETPKPDKSLNKNNSFQNELLRKPEDSFKSMEKISFDRTVDEFDFDESEFLAALNENEPIGLTGDVIKGEIIALESDGLYIDIGGKAPGYMPKKECGLGVITNFKEKFPIGQEMEVLVIKEQNADGMVTVSARALILRQSWENISRISKNGDLINVLINGFNRGGLTCDVDGLRGFIPRSQLEDGSAYQSLVGKTIKVAFLEVNPESRKLVLSEKKALLVAKFSELKLGQLIKGEVLAIKPYGFFINLGGASGLLHQSSVTNGSIRDLREIFVEGEYIKALITEIDLEKGRIGLNTSLLENTPGELLIEKQKVMNEADQRAIKTQALFDKREQSK